MARHTRKSSLMGSAPADILVRRVPKQEMGPPLAVVNCLSGGGARLWMGTPKLVRDSGLTTDTSAPKSSTMSRVKVAPRDETKMRARGNEVSVVGGDMLTLKQNSEPRAIEVGVVAASTRLSVTAWAADEAVAEAVAG